MKHFSKKLMILVLCLILISASALAQQVPYTAKLTAQVEICHGPGEAYGFAKYVGEDGVYTIVEEAYDGYGNLWGKLKSGAGWVMLQEAAPVQVHTVPFTTELAADQDICKGPGYAYGYVKEVGEDGVYTIVEEKLDMEGFLWGRLKSGAGWVRLTDAPIEVPEADSDDTYLVALDAWVPIYNRPDEMEGGCVGIVNEDGVYTIVTEVADDFGNIWGELKSGRGWVNLTYVRTMGRPPLTGYMADAVDLGETWYECTVDDSEYRTRIAFRANEDLQDVRFMTLEYGDVYEVESMHYQMDTIEEDMYLVANVVFYGDMTTYGISYLDADGQEHHCAVSLSGMNGALVMNEYVQ